MYNDVDKQTLREIKTMNSVIESGFKKLNNTIEKGFKAMSADISKRSETSDEWNVVHGPEGSFPSKDQGWVLIKVRKLDSISVDDIPRISLHLGNDLWKVLDTPETYDELGYAVEYWRPMP